MIEIQKLFQLYFGKKYSNKQINDRFHIWRRSVDRDDETRFKIMMDGARSQMSDLSKQWKWVIIQAVLWLWISNKYELQPIINVMAFLSILTQFSFNLSAIVKDKKQLFSIYISRQILDLRNASTMLWDTFEELQEDLSGPVENPKKNYAPDVEWPDITIELVGNRYDEDLPYLRTVIGHDTSSLIHPAEFGLTCKNDRKVSTSAFTMLKLFAEHNPFLFKGHGSKKNSVEKRIQKLRDIFNTYFGQREVSPISQYQESVGWECYINIEDRTKTWKKLEHEHETDIIDMLDKWTFVTKQEDIPLPEKDAYSQKGWDW